MNRLTTLLIILLMPSVLWAVPQAVIDENKLDFGTIFEGQKVKHSYVIRNTGDEALVLSNVRTSCGCTTASYTEQILPGQMGSVDIEFDSRGFANHIRKHIYVNSNDPNKPRLEMILEGEITPFVKIDPVRVRLSGTLGQEISQKVTLTPSKDKPFKITKHFLEKGDRISYSLEQDKERYIITVTHKGQVAGSYWDSLVIKTDSELKPEIRIMIHGTVRK